MAKNQTVPTGQSVTEFLNRVEDEVRKADALALCHFLEEATGMAPQMWGPAIVGFGLRHYKYESGREGDTVVVGFSPRKQNLALYGLHSAEGAEALLARLGKHKSGKGCVYLNRFTDADAAVLRDLVRLAAQNVSG